MKSDNINKIVLLTEFYYKERERLVKRVSYRAGGIFNSEDVVQEAFTRALKYIDSFDPESNKIEGWFNTILMNALKDFNKQERHQGRITDEDKILDDIGEEVDTQRLVIEILNEIAGMREPAREILRRFVVLGYQGKEVAQSLDLNIHTVRKCIKEFYSHIRHTYP